MSKLTPESTINEVFEFFDMEGAGLRVIPITIKQQADDTRLAIFLKGEHEITSVMMAELMTRIDELHDLAAQGDATPKAEDEQPTIIAP